MKVYVTNAKDITREEFENKFGMKTVGYTTHYGGIKYYFAVMELSDISDLLKLSDKWGEPIVLHHNKDGENSLTFTIEETGEEIKDFWTIVIEDDVPDE